MVNVRVEWSWARNNLVIPVSVEVDPFNSLHNIGWIGVYLLYSFTEDANNNGKIDRIRIQGYDTFNLPAGELNGITVEVKGYELNGNPVIFDPGTQGGPPGMLYINLKEKDYTDTNIRPEWKLAANTSLLNPSGRPYSTMREWNTPVDTAPPRIAYALALPGGKEIFVRMTEPVAASVLNSPVTIARSASLPATEPASLAQISGNSGDPLEFIIKVTTAFTAEELVKGAASFYFDDAGTPDGAFQDLAAPAVPLNDHYPVYYPSGYGEYAAGYTASGRQPSNHNRYVPVDPSDYSRRATELLVSVPPQGDGDTRFFVQPVLARNGRIASSGDSSFGTIREFDGTGRLPNVEIILQALVNTAAGGVPGGVSFDLVYEIDKRVGPEYRSLLDRQGMEGFWLPPYAPLMVPRPYGNAETIAGQREGARHFNFTIPHERFEEDAVVDFYFRSSGGGAAGNPDLFVARLDVKPGDQIPQDWYRKIKPFSFNIKDITRQRSGVTILNNVINPDKYEKVYVDYILTRGGRVTIQVFTLDGNLVKVLERSSKSAGEYVAAWDGRNNGGRAVARGLYFIRVVAPDIDEIRKVMVVK
jgi:hypothetical protein